MQELPYLGTSNLYGHRWRQHRLRFLKTHPLCRYCSGRGRIEPATVVDHIIPHKGDLELFWDQANHQPLCKTCHDSAKKLEESGKSGCDAQGNPLGGWMA